MFQFEIHLIVKKLIWTVSTIFLNVAGIGIINARTCNEYRH